MGFSLGGAYALDESVHKPDDIAAVVTFYAAYPDPDFRQRVHPRVPRYDWNDVAPMFSAASRQSRRNPSMAGAMMRTMSGNWKYMYASSSAVFE